MPSLMNMAILTKNIELNGMGDRIFPLPIAVIESPYERSSLCMNTNEPGNTGGQFHGKQTAFNQGIMGFSIESIVRELDIPLPNHIKIDVDGIEPKILRGGTEVLKRDDVKSLSVELEKDSEEFNEAFKILTDVGFELTSESSGDLPIKNFVFRK